MRDSATRQLSSRDQIAGSSGARWTSRALPISAAPGIEPGGSPAKAAC